MEEKKDEGIAEVDKDEEENIKDEDGDGPVLSYWVDDEDEERIYKG